MIAPRPLPSYLFDDVKATAQIRNRIALKLDKSAGPEGCWLWTGARHHHGHGKIGIRDDERGGTRVVMVHRLAWALEHKQDTDLCIDHLCGETACCNPLHLQATTSRINTLRGDGPSAVNAQRTHCKHGHPLYGDNLAIEKGTGKRRCRACMARRSKEWRERVDYGQGGAGTRKYRLAVSGMKTECVNGHPWIPANIVYRKRGHQECKVCHRDRQRRRYLEVKETNA